MNNNLYCVTFFAVFSCVTSLANTNVFFVSISQEAFPVVQARFSAAKVLKKICEDHHMHSPKVMIVSFEVKTPTFSIAFLSLVSLGQFLREETFKFEF